MARERTVARQRARSSTALLVASAGALLLAASVPAMAQKNADTVRLANADPIVTVLGYDDVKPESRPTTAAVFDTLVCYDKARAEFIPSLAESWRQVDDLTLEFKLRQDVKFHDGVLLTAEDVAYTLNWLIDPNSKLRITPEMFSWLDNAEVVDRFTVRLHNKQTAPMAMVWLATRAPIIPAKLHRSYENRPDFGRKTPIGTGPYKVVKYDVSTGIELVRNDSFVHGSSCNPAARIGHVRVSQIPDAQTQMAQIAVGGIDIIRTQTKDAADQLALDPNVAIAAFEGNGIQLLIFDASNRSGLAALSDRRVRQAIGQSIDRKLVAISMIPGGEAVRVANAVCIEGEPGCAVSHLPAPYDPQAARRLLGEAGFPSGIDLTLTTIPGSFPIADAVAGEMRKIGVRATVEKSTFAAYRQKQSEGKLQAFIIMLPSTIDVAGQSSYLFDDTPRNYTRDSKVEALHRLVMTTLDAGKRTAIVRELNDRVNDESFILPLAVVPDLFAHTTAVDVDTTGTWLMFNRMDWRKN